MRTDSRPDTQSPPPPADAAAETHSARAQRFFFGDDIFISYARHDSDYALALADELTRRDLSCFLDQWGTPPGVELPSELVERLRKATMLVIVGTESAARSENVMKEVVEFARMKRPIIPITFVAEEDFLRVRNNEMPEGLRGSLEEAEWYGEIAGIARTVESKARLKSAGPDAAVGPSAQVVTRIANADGFLSRSKRLRKTFWTTLASLTALLAAAGLVAWLLVDRAYAQVTQAQAAQTQAEKAARDAELTRAEAQRAKEQAVTDLADAETKTAQAQRALTAAQDELKKASADLLAANEKTREEQARAARARREAQHQERLANSQLLAARAVSHMEVDPEQSVLLAREAYAVAPTEQAGSALRRSLLRSSVHAVLTSGDGYGGTPVFDETGEFAVSEGENGTWYVRRAETGELLKTLPPADGRGRGPSFSPDGRYVYVTSADDTKDVVQLWEWRAALSPSNPRALRGDVAQGATTPRHCVIDTCSITSTDFSADGKYLAAASRRGRVWVWDTANTERVATLTVGEVALNQVKFSPGDSQYLLFDEERYVTQTSGLTNEDDERLLRWEWRAALGDGNPRALRQPGHVSSFDIDPSGRFVVAAVNREEREINPEQPQGYQNQTEDRTTPASHLVNVFDLETFTHQLTLGGHLAAVNEVSFSPDGRYLLTASQDTTARVYSWQDPRMRRRPVTLKHGGTVYSASFDPTGEYVVTSGDDNAPRLWKPGIGRVFAQQNGLSMDSPPVAVLRGHRGRASASFSSDGRRILTVSSEDGTARLWRAEAGRVKEPLRVEGQLGGAALSPDGRHLVTANWGDPLRVWRAEGGGHTAEAELGAAEADGYQQAAFSPDGRLVVAATYARQGVVNTQAVRAWEWRDGARRRLPRTVEQGEGQLTGLAVSHAAEGAAYVATARTVKREAAGREETAHVARVWNLRAAEGAPEAAALPHPQPVVAVAFSHDRESKYLATASGAELRIFDWAESNQPLHILRGSGNIGFTNVAFSPDGNYVAATGYAGVALVWEWRTESGRAAPVMLRPEASSLGPARHFFSVAFSPDSKLVITTASDDAIWLWEHRTGEPLRLIGEGRGATFSRDGRFIVAAYERSARLYECPECRAEETLCALVPERISRQTARGRKAARPCPEGSR